MSPKYPLDSVTHFATYRRCAIEQARAILSRGRPGEYDEQALPAYSHRNPLMRWLFWQRLRLVSRHLQRTLPRGARVLDFGCGVGMLLPLLGVQGHSLTGIDVDVRNTATFLAAFGITGASILHADRLTTLAPGTYDAVTALDVLEHVPDLEGTVRQLIALLKPGGKLVICGPTENVLYKIGRWFAGFSGDYHVRNIEDIYQVVARQVPTVRLGTLYPGMPLFRIFEGSKAAVASAAA